MAIRRGFARLPGVLFPAENGGGANLGTLSSSAGREQSDKSGRKVVERGSPVQLPDSSALLNLGNQAHLIELFPMAAYAVRAPDGIIVWFNSRAADLWGRVPVIGDTGERFSGAHALYRVDGTYITHCDTPVAIALTTGASLHDKEVIIARPDGSRVTVSMHVDPIRDKDGTIAGVVNFFYDFRERKQAEQTTRLLAAIVDSSDDAIISKNLDGTIITWNKGAERIFGYSPEEAIGHQITMLIPPDRLDEEVAIIERLKRGERVEHYETVRLRKGGIPVHLSLTISPVKDAYGRINGASKIARDITERKQVEQALAERAALLDLSNDAILVRDGDDRITYWNNGASELYGFSRDEAIGRVSHELLQTEFPESLEQITEKLHRDCRWSGELIHKRKDGNQIMVVSRWALDWNHGGNLKRVLETNNDITQQKQLESELRGSEERLRGLANELENQVRVRTHLLEERNMEVLQQSEQLRQLSSRLLRTQDDERRRIARELHDSFGQVLTVLGLNLASIAEGAGRNAKVSKPVEESRELVHQLGREIRTLSYLLHPPLLDEAGLSHAIRWYMKGLADRSGLKINLDISDDFGRFQEDLEVAIFRIVQEALTNIHRHSGSKSATIRLTQSPSAVSLEIQDDGKGIQKEILAAIQSHRSGVGIAGMRARVRDLGGNLDIQSGSNGTKISVTLPLSEAKISKADSVAG
jgi:PAS domain S-box-containing protein